MRRRQFDPGDGAEVRVAESAARARMDEPASIDVGLALSLRWVIQTAPSTVARQMAPSRLAMHAARRALQAVLVMRAIEKDRHAEERIEHARRAVGRADLAHDGVGRIARPVDGAVLLRHGRAQTAAHLRPGIIERLRPEAAATRICPPPPGRRARRPRSLRCDRGCPWRPRRAGSGNSWLAQIGPASISSAACSTVTPQRVSPSVIAQSSEDGPAVAHDARMHDEADVRASRYPPARPLSAWARR